MKQADKNAANKNSQNLNEETNSMPPIQMLSHEGLSLFNFSE